jgi:flagellum-specific peptidoglycan hydrolase FlgJ
MEQTNNKRFTKIKNKFASVIVILMMSFLLIGTNVNSRPINTSECTTYMKQQVIHKDKQQIKEELILEVSKYVNSVTSKSNQFIPKYIVQAGLNNDIDICFMLAQTKIETCFGTTGIGRSKRSLFGVVSRSYSNYELAINDWCALLKKSYLVKGRTEQTLMAKYITAGGTRYAANRNYEKELRSAYNDIKRSTNIYSLQQEYKRM